MTRNPASRQDLEDLLNVPEYFQATFYSLPRVTEILRSQVELGRANEAIASKVQILIATCSILRSFSEKTLAFQDHVYKLRAETQQAFDEAKALEVKAKQLERKQQELHQVYIFFYFFPPLPRSRPPSPSRCGLIAPAAICSFFPPSPTEARHNCAR